MIGVLEQAIKFWIHLFFSEFNRTYSHSNKATESEKRNNKTVEISEEAVSISQSANRSVSVIWNKVSLQSQRFFISINFKNYCFSATCDINVEYTHFLYKKLFYKKLTLRSPKS